MIMIGRGQCYPDGVPGSKLCARNRNDLAVVPEGRRERGLSADSEEFRCPARQRIQKTPRLIDIPYSIMRLFGQTPPDYMQGRMIFAGKDEAPGGATTRGLLDPASLPQSGSAPGALVSKTPAWSVDHVC